MSVPAYQMARSGLGVGSGLAGIYGGLQRGGLGGYGSALLSAGRLANNAGYMPSGSGSYLGGAGNALGLYSGLRQGGVQGDTSAAINAAQLGSKLGVLPSSVGQYAPYAAIPLAAYNFVQNDTASGRTGQDALGGAETGAEAGAAFGPVGMGIGAVVGGLGGALASAFGPGARDPEQNTYGAYDAAVQKYGPQYANLIASKISNPYLDLAGLFDSRSSPMPIYQQYGRMGEQKFTNDLVQQVNQAYAKGTINKGSSVNDIWNKVVDPWTNSMGKGWAGSGQPQYVPQVQALLKQMISQYTKGQAPQDWKAVGGDSPFASLPAYGSDPNVSLYGKPASGNQFGIGSFHRGMRMAKGGDTRSKLRALYKDSFARRARFDGGGSTNYYSNYLSSALPSVDQYQGGSGPGMDQTYTDPFAAPGGGVDVSGLGQQAGQDALQQAMTQYQDPFASQQGSQDVQNTLSQYAQGSQNMGALGPTNISTSGLAGALRSLLGGSGTGSNTGSALQLLSALSPLIGALTKPGNAAQPSVSPGYQPIQPVATPQFQRQYSQPNVADWYKYGQGPEQSFFSNNQLPTIPGVSPGTGAATPQQQQPTNATTQPISPNLGPRAVMAGGGSAFDSTQGDSYVQDPGHGDGTSDDIDARLSGGEYVMDAGTVSMLGNGSNEAGARALDQLRQRVRKHAGKQHVKGKQFMKAKAPNAYLKKGAGD